MPRSTRSRPPARGSGGPRPPAAASGRADPERATTGWRLPVLGLGWWLVAAAVVVVGALIVVPRLGPASSSSSQSRGNPPSGVQVVDEPNRTHVTGTVAYDRTPPAGGNHASVWLNCGIYDQPVANENAVHSLEHGSVWIAYQPSLAAADVQSLRALVTSKYDRTERYVILSPYPGLPAPVIATAWGHQLPLQSVSDPRIAQFIDYYRAGPQDLEPGAACSGGVGSPIG